MTNDIQGKFVSLDEYLELFKKHNVMEYNDKVYISYYNCNNKKNIVVRNISSSTKEKAGTYSFYSIDEINGMIISNTNDFAKQKRWLKCLLFFKDNSCKLHYLFFDPKMIENITKTV